MRPAGLAFLLLCACAARPDAPTGPRPASVPGETLFPPPRMAPTRFEQPATGPELVAANRFVFDLAGDRPRLVDIRPIRTVGFDSFDRGESIALLALNDDATIVAAASRVHPREARTAGERHGDLEYQTGPGQILVNAVWPADIEIDAVRIELRAGPGAGGVVKLP